MRLTPSGSETSNLAIIEWATSALATSASIIGACSVLTTSSITLAAGDEAEIESTQPARDANPAGYGIPPDEAAPRRTPSEAIEEIKITGRRREETVQQAPVSVTAFGAIDLEDLEINRLEDLTRFVPNLQFDAAATTQNAARVFLRGIGNDDAIVTDEGGVGITVDDVFLPRASGTLLSISDVERVEVLAGPQATLYGKNTVGGLIRYLTKRPELDVFNGRASLRLGNFEQVETRLMLNVPLLSDRLAMRVNLGTDYNKGLARNRGPGRDRSLQSRSLKAQVQFLLQPTEDFDILLKGYHTNNPNSGFSAKCDLSAGLDPNSVAGRLFGSNADPEGLRGSFSQECARDQARGFEKISSDSELEDELRTFGASLHMTYSPSSSFSFRSITAWNRNDTNRRFDGDATPLPLAQPLGSDKTESTQDSISQEFNFSGLALGYRLNWVAGVYGLVEKNQDDVRDTTSVATFLDPEEFRFADLSQALLFGSLPIGALGSTEAGLGVLEDFLPDATALGPNILAPGAALAPSEIPLRLTNGAAPDCVPGTEQTLRLPADLSAAGLPGITPLSVPSCRREFSGFQTGGFRKSNVTSYAAYGQLGYHFTDEISLDVGVRYTHERKRVARFVRVLESSIPLTREPATIARGFLVNNFEFSERFGRFSPSVSLSYQPTENLNLYLLWGRGFKSGGFNGRGVGDQGEVITYDPEKVSTYEFGVKSRWFDNRLTVNSSLFSTHYDDIQLANVQFNQASGRPTLVTDNAGEARINGAEVSVIARPLDRLTIRANGGITAGRYTKVEPANGSFFPLVGPNDRLLGTPTYTVSMSVTYGLPVGSFGDLLSTFTWSHQGKKATNANNSQFSNKFGLLSGRMSLELPDGKTRIALFGSNLLNREYVANSLDAVAFNLQFFGPPRQFGIEVLRSF